MSTSLSDKIGLVVGVANKRSISWAIAKAAAEQGATVVLTFQNERLAENVRELAAPLLLPCDVSDDAQIAAVFEAIDKQYGRLDFLVHGTAFANREDLDRPFV